MAPLVSDRRGVLPARDRGCRRRLVLDPRRASGPTKRNSFRAAAAGQPSIAVLPFQNVGDDAQQGYFADGLTDDLITELSKISGLLTIARDSVFNYKDKALDIRQVAKELWVRYVLQGSMRRAGEHLESMRS